MKNKNGIIHIKVFKKNILSKYTINPSISVFIILVLLISLFSQSITGDNISYHRPLSEESLLSGTLNSSWPMFGQNVKHTCKTDYGKKSNTAYLKWKIPINEDSIIKGSPVIDNEGTIYIAGTIAHYLFAINPNGTEKWRFRTKGWIESSPALGNDHIIYVGDDKGYFYAIDFNGSEKWLINTQKKIFSSPTIGDDGTIYFGTYNNGSLYALNSDGTVKWIFYTENRIYSSPAFDKDTIYFGSFDKYFYALNLDGTLKWRYELGPIGSSPCIDNNGYVYITSTDGELLSFYPNGTIRWSVEIDSRIYGSWTSLAIGRFGNIYIGTDDRFCAVSSNGDVLWQYFVWNGFTSNPAIDDYGIIYIPSDEGDFFAFNSNGSLVWSHHFGDFIHSSPAIGPDGTVYQAVWDGYLYAFEVLENHPPGIPKKPIGPDGGYAWEEYTFSASTVDSDGDSIYYLFDWGDGTDSGWIGPYNSGEIVTARHIWMDGEDFNVRVKAKDDLDCYNSKSEWSESAMISLKGSNIEILGFIGGFSIKVILCNIGISSAYNIPWSVKIYSEYWGGNIDKFTGDIYVFRPGAVKVLNLHFYNSYSPFIYAKINVTVGTERKIKEVFILGLGTPLILVIKEWTDFLFDNDQDYLLYLDKCKIQNLIRDNRINGGIM